MRRITRIALAPVGSVALVVLGFAGPAHARPVCDNNSPCPAPTQGASQGTATATVSVNSGYTLTVRAAPESDAARVRQLDNGVQVVIVCQTNGDKVTGKFGTTTLWDQLEGGGYVSDAYMYTGSDGRVAKDCGTSPAPKPPGGTPRDVTLHDDYPYRTDSPNSVDPWGFYKRECTSFVAWRLNKIMKFSNTMRGGRFANAINWDNNARKIGLKVDRSPTPGSVMVRNSGRFGHVAIVAKTRKGGVYVEQYNAAGTHKYSQQWLTITSVMDFIHFK